ncbi:hypothetical protein ABZ517_04920 [Streptomyces scabiei]|uniref:hypothetical protein n=1 Tax=Streptomyces scabiei TaxID=1930 RepID=UPI0033F8C6AA
MTDSDEGPGGEDTDHRGRPHADREGHEMPSRRTDPAGGEGRRADGPGAATPSCATPSVDSLLAAAVRGGAGAGSVGEARAVAAFRAVWERGARTARTRRRDDWRPNARRRVQLSIRSTLAVLLAGLTLGGVAFAAIGPAAREDEGAGREPTGDGGGDRRLRTTHGAPVRPGPATADRPDREPTASRQPDGTGRQSDGDDRSHGGDKRKDKGNGNGKGNGKGKGSLKSEGEGKGDARGPVSRPGASRVPDEPGPPDGVRNPAGAERAPTGTGRKPRGEVRAPETK